MKFLISVVLLLASVDAIDKIDTGSDRHESKLLLHLAGSLGCALNCTYKPQNVAQLGVCLATTHLGNNMKKLFECGVNFKAECAKATTTCGWIEAPTSWEVFTRLNTESGFCVSKIISDNKVAFIGVLSAFKPLLDAGRYLSFRKLMEDLLKSEASCTPPRSTCKIPAKNYPMSPPLTQLCFEVDWFSLACTMIKDDTNLEFCPGKDPTYQALAIEVAKLPCYQDSCPKTECTKACPVLDCPT